MKRYAQMKKIIEFFSGKQISVTLVVSNNPKSGVLEIARKHQIATLLIEKEQFFKDVREKRKKQVITNLLTGAIRFRINRYRYSWKSR